MQQLQTSQKQTEFVSLKAPILLKQNLISILVKQDGYRQNGIRINHEQIEGKHIFHNYGHGRAQSSTAYGSSYIIAQSIVMHIPVGTPVKVAIIGSGLTGLFTAIELRKKGYSCTIYADKFPVRGQKDPSKLLRCQVDPGLWVPLGVSKGDILDFEIMSKQTYDFYKNCIKTNQYQSMKVTDIYEKSVTQKQLRSSILPFIINNYKTKQVSFGGIIEEYLHFRTVKIDMELFVEELRIQCLIRGVKFVGKRFNNLQDVINLEEGAIFNCSGNSSKYLFNDNTIRSVPSHIAYFNNNNNNSPMNYSLGTIHQGIEVKISCSNNRVILGPFSIEKAQKYSSEYTNEQNIKNLIRGAENFIEEKTKLKGRL